MPARTPRGSGAPLLLYVLAFFAWNLATSIALVALPALAGLAAALALTAAFLWGSMLRAPRPARHWAMLRLRPLSGARLRWTLLLVPTFVAFMWALGDVYVRLVPVPPENFDPFEALATGPVGRLSVTILAVAIAPLTEELLFRGLVQSRLERRYGAAAALGISALAFALVHFRPWLLPLHLALGLAFGFVVWATRSVWASVLLHAVNNLMATVGVGLQDGPPEPIPTVWETGFDAGFWTSVAALAVFGALFARLAQELAKAGRGPGLRPAARGA